MKKCNFAVLALICLGRIEATEGIPDPVPVEINAGKSVEKTQEPDDQSSKQEEAKYQKLLLSMQSLSEALLKYQNDNPVADSDEDLKTGTKKDPVPEESAAKIAYKNEVRQFKNKKTGKKQSRVVNQEVVITLTKDFFDKQGNKSLSFNPGTDDGKVIRISYENANEGLIPEEPKQPKPDGRVALADALPENQPRIAPDQSSDTKADPIDQPILAPQPEPKLPKPDPVAASNMPALPSDPITNPVPKPEIRKLDPVNPVAFADESAKVEPKVAYAEFEADTSSVSPYSRPFYKGHIVDLSGQETPAIQQVHAQKNESHYAEITIQNNLQPESQNTPNEYNKGWAPPYLAEEREEQACCTNSCETPATQLILGYTFGKGIETNKNYATATIMVFPNIRRRNIIPFVSLSAHHLSNNKWAGSFGGGARWQPDGSCYLLGFNVFYDTLKRNLGTFEQVGAGVEYLSSTWEGRINAYFPVGTKYRSKLATTFDGYDGGYFININQIERSSRGFDAEIGWNTYFCNQYRFYTGVGPAWFEDYNSFRNQWAFKARALIQWSRYLTFEVRTFKEENRAWHWQGAAFLTVPFECIEDFCSCGLTDLFARPVYRNALIKSSSECGWETNY